MSNGIAHNNLNDISKLYLDTISDINKKDKEDDVNRWTQKEETACKSESPFRKKKVKEDWQPEIEHSKLGDAKKKADKKRESKLPPHLRGDAIGKMKKAFANEGYSDWRTSLREVTSDAEATDIDNQPEIKEKKVKNKIKINPSFLEAVKEMGGELLEVKEIDDVEDDKDEKASQKEKRLKLRLLRVKMMAVKQGADDSIVAGYEPDIEGAIEYFYEEGINEEGIDQLIEEIGLDEFVNFIEGGTVELNEERKARKASVRAKSYAKVKAEVDASDAAKKKAKKGEYAPSYAKKETDVTVYDDKPSAKKSAPAKKAKPAKKAAAPAKKPVTPKKPAAPKKPVTKKVVKAVAKVKKTQPKKKPSKQGLGDKIRSAYKKGVERHKKARAAGRVPEKRAKEFAKGVGSGVKTAVKFAKDVKKVVSKEELELAELNRYAKETGKNTGALNKRPGSPVKPKGDEPGALRNVRGMMRQQTGKPEGQKRSDYDARGRGQDRREKPSRTIERIRSMRKRADAAMRDTSGT